MYIYVYIYIMRDCFIVIGSYLVKTVYRYNRGSKRIFLLQLLFITKRIRTAAAAADFDGAALSND